MMHEGRNNYSYIRQASVSDVPLAIDFPGRWRTLYRRGQLLLADTRHAGAAWAARKTRKISEYRTRHASTSNVRSNDVASIKDQSSNHRTKIAWTSCVVIYGLLPPRRAESTWITISGSLVRSQWKWETVSKEFNYSILSAFLPVPLRLVNFTFQSSFLRPGSIVRVLKEPRFFEEVERKRSLWEECSFDRFQH